MGVCPACSSGEKAQRDEDEPDSVVRVGPEEHAIEELAVSPADASRGRLKRQSSLPNFENAGVPSAADRNLSTSAQHPLLAQDANIARCICFVRQEAFTHLCTPMPRQQDLPPTSFGIPGMGDVIVSVSHPWRNQCHPDASGTQLRETKAILARICKSLGPGIEVFVFYDFLSMPQRALALGQAPRTSSEEDRFHTALLLMHHVYFHADYVVHLECEVAEVSGEGQVKIVNCADLASASFEKVGSHVQITAAKDAKLDNPSSVSWCLYDIVLGRDDEPIDSVEIVEAQIAKKRGTLRLKAYPFGRVNCVPAGERGWIYCERVVTMVKCAMVDADDAEKIVQSNHPDIKSQILDGGRRIFAAVTRSSMDSSGGQRRRRRSSEYTPSEVPQNVVQMAGRPAATRCPLDEILDEFRRELWSKHFSAASMDKSLSTRKPTSDEAVVGSIMAMFIEDLKPNWTAEAVRQHERAGCAQGSGWHDKIDARLFRSEPSKTTAKAARLNSV